MLFLDTSALLKRYVKEAGSPIVIDAMSADTDWIASALALAEAAVTLCHRSLEAATEVGLRGRLTDDWGRFNVVPVDQRCLLDAASIGCAHGVRTLDAIHLAAADRLPRPFRFLTFDDRQAAAAREMDMDVISPL